MSRCPVMKIKKICGHTLVLANHEELNLLLRKFFCIPSIKAKISATADIFALRFWPLGVSATLR